MPPVAVYDACVLYAAALRDLLMRLTMLGAVRAHWTETIHEEWMRSLLASRPDLSREQLERTKSLMNAHAQDALIAGYESLIPGLALPDPKDRHVLAAAISARARFIVTLNLSDFPARALIPYGVQAQHPDDFISQLLDDAPDLVCEAARQHRASLKNPPKSIAEYLETLGRVRLMQVADRLRAFEDAI
jgi:hypothetical protein